MKFKNRSKWLQFYSEKWHEEIESKIWHYFWPKTAKTSFFLIEIKMNHISVLEQFGKMLKNSSRIRLMFYRTEVFVVSAINDAKIWTRFLGAFFKMKLQLLRTLLSRFFEILSLVCLYGFKSSSDPSHFIFEINVGKSRIRHRTTLK